MPGTILGSWDIFLDKISKHLSLIVCGGLGCTINNTLHIIIINLFSMIKDDKSCGKGRVEQGK